MILLALALQAAAPPAAGPPAQPPATMVVEPVAMAIAAFDDDRDGRVTARELEAGARRSFEAIEGGRSGSLGYIGFADWAERWLGDRNALPSPFETDANGDDRISLVELQAKLAAIFLRLDRDRDGALTRAELLTIRTGIEPNRRPDGKPPRSRRPAG